MGKIQKSKAVEFGDHYIVAPNGSTGLVFNSRNGKYYAQTKRGSLRPVKSLWEM